MQNRLRRGTGAERVREEPVLCAVSGVEKSWPTAPLSAPPWAGWRSGSSLQKIPHAPPGPPGKRNRQRRRSKPPSAQMSYLVALFSLTTPGPFGTL